MNRTLKVKKIENEYYAYFQDKEGKDIMFGDEVARLSLSRSRKLFDNLGNQFGSLRLNPSKKRLKLIDNWNNQETSYKSNNNEKEHDAWELIVSDKHFNQLLEQVDHEWKEEALKTLKKSESKRKRMIRNQGKRGKKFKKLDLYVFENLTKKVKDSKKRLLSIYQRELKAEKDYWETNQKYLTNSSHVEYLEKKVNQWGGET